MASEWFDAGAAMRISIDAGEYGSEFRQPVTITTARPTSLAFRVALAAQLAKRKGYVIRAVDAQVELAGFGTVTPTVAALAAAGATAQALLATPARINVASPGRPADWRVRWRWDVPDASVPLGLLYSSAQDANSPEWAGVATQAVVLNASGLPDFSLTLRLATESTRIRYLLSRKPEWQLAVPESLGTGQSGAIQLRVAYPDGEPVVGLRIRLQAENTAIAFGSNLSYDVTVATDGNGRISVPVRAVHSGASAVHIAVADQRCAAEFFSPPLVAVRPINASVVRVDGQDCILIPAVARVPPIPATHTERPTFAWDAGANSEQSLSGDLAVEFSGAQAVVGAIVGLTDDRDTPEDPSRIAHGWYLHTDVLGVPQAQPYERGKVASAPVPYTPATKFRIERRGERVASFIDDALVRETRSTLAGDVSVGAALFGTGDFIFEFEEGGGDDGGDGDAVVAAVCLQPDGANRITMYAEDFCDSAAAAYAQRAFDEFETGPADAYIVGLGAEDGASVCGADVASGSFESTVAWDADLSLAAATSGSAFALTNNGYWLNQYAGQQRLFAVGFWTDPPGGPLSDRPPPDATFYVRCKVGD